MSRSLSINDTERFRKHMKVLDEISDPPRRCGTFNLYKFWVKDETYKGDKMIYECTTRKQILTKEEVYKVVRSCLPDDVKIGQLLVSPQNYCGHRSLNDETDILKEYDFILH